MCRDEDDYSDDDDDVWCCPDLDGTPYEDESYWEPQCVPSSSNICSRPYDDVGVELYLECP